EKTHVTLTFRRRDKREVDCRFYSRPLHLRFTKEYPFKIEAIGHGYCGSKTLKEEWALTHVDGERIGKERGAAAKQ
ncbi:unnamed protein product, partial [Symbiodinium sp. KB8]